MDMKLRPVVVAITSLLLTVQTTAASTSAAVQQIAVSGDSVLLAPTTNAYAGVLLQHCAGGVATLRVILPEPRLLRDTEFLAVEVAGIETPAIRVDANKEAPEIVGFQGRSTVGCIAPGTHFVLVSSPGGVLRGLLLVLGAGILVTP